MQDNAANPAAIPSDAVAAEAPRADKASATPALPGSHSRLYVIAIGFGTAVAVWTICFFVLMLGVHQLVGEDAKHVESAVLFGLILFAMFAGGFVAGKATGRGPLAGAATGAVSALVNVLILGSLMGGATPGEIAAEQWLWLPGTFGAAIVLGAIGAIIGTAKYRRAQIDGATAKAGKVAHDDPRARWVHAMARVTVVATLLLVIAGGLVTGYEAGLAVPDWPDSFSYNMILFPAEQMLGDKGIFHEHAHRLFGTLVGLATVVLTVMVFVTERRGWVKGYAVGMVVLVCAQGAMGGIRVTDQSTLLAIVHGVTGQLFFAAIVALAAFTSARWMDRGTPKLPRISAGTDRGLPVTLLVLLTIQLTLGAIMRQSAESWQGVSHGVIGLHILVALIALGLAIMLVIRMSAHRAELPLLSKKAMGLMHLTWFQIALGGTALIATAVDSEAFDAIATTVHQATGAMILGYVASLTVWTRRTLQPIPDQPATPANPPVA